MVALRAMAKARSKGRAAKRVVKDRKKKSATACSVAKGTAACNEPSNNLLKAACLSEGSSGKEAVAAFVGRFGFKLPKSTPLGAEMFKIMKTASACGDATASACGDATGEIPFDEVVTLRTTVFKEAAKFLALWEKSASCDKFRPWVTKLRWRLADKLLKTSTLAQAVGGMKIRCANAKFNKLDIRPNAAACGAAEKTDEGTGAIRVATPLGEVLFMPPHIANWLYQAFADVLRAFQSVLGGSGGGSGGGAFDANGAYLTEAGQPACGGEIVAWWGTELGSRRQQAIVDRASWA